MEERTKRTQRTHSSHRVQSLTTRTNPITRNEHQTRGHIVCVEYQWFQSVGASRVLVVPKMSVLPGYQCFQGASRVSVAPKCQYFRSDDLVVTTRRTVPNPHTTKGKVGHRSEARPCHNRNNLSNSCAMTSEHPRS